MPGEHDRSVRPGAEVDVVRKRLGPIGIVTLWNFPVAIQAWKIASALAYGATVVFKPAELALNNREGLTAAWVRVPPRPPLRRADQPW